MTAAVRARPADARVFGGARRFAYVLLAIVGLLTSAGIWVLMVVDEDRSVAAATVQMAVKFTNLTCVVVAIVAIWLASPGAPRSFRTVAHLTAMLMAVVTAAVNATLLGPGLPGGWWGVVDLSQHYVMPAATVALWVMVGPRIELPKVWLPSVLVVPLVWCVFVLVRGEVTDSYPYDFIDPVENGWGSVLGTVAGIVAFMLLSGAAFTGIDRRRRRVRVSRSR